MRHVETEMKNIYFWSRDKCRSINKDTNYEVIVISHRLILWSSWETDRKDSRREGAKRKLWGRIEGEGASYCLEVPRRCPLVLLIIIEWEWKLVQIIFKNSVRTAKKTQHFTITKINWLTLFNKVISVYSECHTNLTNTFCAQNAELLIKAGGIHSCHWILKG
jgi:hypothetical protein